MPLSGSSTLHGVNPNLKKRERERQRERDRETEIFPAAKMPKKRPPKIFNIVRGSSPILVILRYDEVRFLYSFFEKDWPLSLSKL